MQSEAADLPYRKESFLPQQFFSGNTTLYIPPPANDWFRFSTAPAKSGSQTAVQGYIADFLCQCRGYMNGVQVSELLDNKKPKGYEGKYLSKMVRFVASQDAGKCDNSTKKKNKSKDISKDTDEGKTIGEINIKDLIEIEKDIFDKKK